jgi:hypothetical protein
MLGVPNGATLYGLDTRQPFTDALDPTERTFLLMPAVVDRTNAHLTPLVSLVHGLDQAATATAVVS